jgi:hypothetical protein
VINAVKVEASAPLVSPAYDDETPEREVVSLRMRSHAGLRGTSSRIGG